jgi:hypothetical protein
VKIQIQIQEQPGFRLATAITGRRSPVAGRGSAIAGRRSPVAGRVAGEAGDKGILFFNQLFHNICYLFC